MTVRHLLSAADLSADEATAILDDADRFRQALLGRDVKKLPTLRGRTIITMFYENSTRTRVSFEVAGKWMSADVINVSSSGSSVSKGESLRDTALTLRAAGADALIIRHPASGAAQQLAEWTAEDDGAGPSVINAGDGTHEHPTQALLDALTIRQRLGGIEGRRIVIVGDVLHSRVARSNVAYEQLVEKLAAHDVERRYLTLVWGTPNSTSGMVDAPIGRSIREPTRMVVSATGKEARTRYEVKQTFIEPSPVALVECQLETGRTHQIRVHMSAIGHPVVGDERYRGVRQTIPSPRMVLHSAAIAFDHPTRTDERLAFESPLPADLAAVIAQLH